MLTKRDRTALYKQMQELRRIRIENVRRVMELAGGWEELGRFVGVNPNWLRQMAGDNPSRDISEKTARRLEFDFGQPPGWLDVKHD